VDSLSGKPPFVSPSGGFVIPVVQGSWIKMLAMMPARRTWAPHPLLPRGSFIVGKVTPDSSAVRSPCWPGKWACCMVFNHTAPWSFLVENYHSFGRSSSGQHSHAAESARTTNAVGRCLWPQPCARAGTALSIQTCLCLIHGYCYSDAFRSALHRVHSV
jgi:hypothetical protein